MADWWCQACGARTSMMGHGEKHDEILMGHVATLVESGLSPHVAVDRIGMWQVGEDPMPEALYSAPKDKEESR